MEPGALVLLTSGYKMTLIIATRDTEAGAGTSVGSTDWIMCCVLIGVTLGYSDDIDSAVKVG